MGQKFRRLDPGNRAVNECSELLALFVADGGCQVLNFNQALAHEYNLRDFADTGDPGIADQLRIEPEQSFGLLGISSSGGFPLQPPWPRVERAKGIDVGDEVVLVREAPRELDLLILPRFGHSDALIL